MNPDTYDRKFYTKDLAEGRARSFRALAAILWQMYKPESVIDYGCGSAWILYHLKTAGVKKIRGVEPSAVAMEIQTDPEVIDSVIQQSLHVPLQIPEDRFDMAICLEVVEHIDGEFSDIVVANVTAQSDLLVFSAAPPGQGGNDHVNEQPWEYWESKFTALGFTENKVESTAIQQFLKLNKAKSWYCNNTRILRRNNG